MAPRKKSNPVADLSLQLLDALRVERQQRPGEFLTLRQLAEMARVTASEAEIIKAAAGKPFSEYAVLAVKKLLDAPVALDEDITQLAGSPLLLEFALGRVCTPEKPLCPLNDLVKKAKLIPQLGPLLNAALQRQLDTHSLPATVSSLELEKGPALYLKSLPPGEPFLVAHRLLEVVRRAKAAGGNAYPLPLRQLLAQAALLPPGDTSALGTLGHVEMEPQAPFKQLQTALTDTEPGQAILLSDDRLEAPVALTSDLKLLAESDVLLVELLEMYSTPDKWQWSVKELSAHLSNAKLKRAFEAGIKARLADNRWPTGVGVLTLQKKPHLYLARFRPPPSAAELLAARLLAALRTKQIPDGSGYPTTLEQLLQDVGETAEPEQLRTVIKQPLFEEAILALTGNLAAPLALREDAALLAGSPTVLLFALRSTSSSENRALPIGELKKVLAKELQKPFEQATAGRLASGQLPEEVGALMIKCKPYVFLLEHIQQRQPPVPVEDRAQQVVEAVSDLVEEAVLQDFAGEFHRAFDRLDQEAGGHNYVSLLELRKALPVDREHFDAGLQQLRQDGLYSLSAIEGRHGIKPEEMEAAIAEEGSLLFYVSRKGVPAQNWVEVP